MEHSDASLVELCLAGRQQAYAELVDRYQHRVFNLALRFTGDRDEAADVAQDTFVRAYRKLAAYDPEYSFGTWLLTICANLAKNRLRGESRRRRAQQTHAELYPPGPTPPDLRKAALEDAMSQLPADQRAALVLKHVEGLSYEEIAEILSIGPSAAKMRVKRARDQLIALLRPSAGGDMS